MNPPGLLGGFQRHVVILGAVVFWRIGSKLSKQRGPDCKHVTNVVIVAEQVDAEVRLESRSDELAVGRELIFVAVQDIRVGVLIDGFCIFK